MPAPSFIKQAAPDQGMDPNTFFSLPDAYPLEFGQGKVSLAPMTRETYARSIFLDSGRIVAAGQQGWVFAIDAMLQEFERRQVPIRPLKFIFHLAHCGSTLLSRALDVPGRTLVLREPYTLRQLGASAASRPEGPGNPEIWQRCLRMMTGLLSRRWSDQEEVLVKANVPVNFIIDPLLAVAPPSRGVLLHCGFERYVLSVLKTRDHQNWVANVTRHMAGGIATTPGLASVDPAVLTTPEAAACLWLAQMRRFEAALAAHGGLASLDCDAFFADPATVLPAVVRWLGVDIPDEQIAGIAASELFRRHGKDPGRPYGQADRERELALLAEGMAQPLEQARRWLHGVAGDSTADLALGRPLAS